MAKQKKKKKKQQITTPSKPHRSFLDSLENPKYILGFFVILFVVLAFLYKPMVFKGMEPGGSDIVSGIGKTHQLDVWKEKTGEYPLWNPFMFGGMPRYHRVGPQVWSVDTLLNKLDFLGDWRLWFFLAGALGVFLLVKYLGMSAAVGMVAATAFVLMPHFQALIVVGHFSKFRALMWMPYVLLTGLMFVQRRTILSALLFIMALALQFRTQHYQIMFYTLLLVLFMVLPFIYDLIKQKQWKFIGKLAGLSVGVGVLTILIVSQNLLTIQEYTPHSTRGGHAISIENQENSNQTSKEAKGVGFDYATNWSYSVSELWNLIIPKFHGGTSNELYTGDAVPQLRNRKLPTYWGSMPFTQSYEYLGIVIVFLGLVGIIFQWHRKEVKSLTILTGLALLMALGKHFAPLYRLFFYYVPYFDKFRVPMMILTLVMFNMSVLAAFGLSFLLKMDYRSKETTQKIYILSGIFVVFVLIPLLFGSSFSLSKSGEAQRFGQQGEQIVEMLKKVRLEMLRDSALKSLIFLLLGVLGIFTVQKKWITSQALPVIFLLIIAVDLLILDAHYLDDNFIDPQRIEQRQYQLTRVDRAIQKDKSLYRVFPVGQLFEDTHWTYYYQSIGGYSPAKLQEIQEIRENNLYVNVTGNVPINWNMVDMLNGKYVISNQQLPSSRLRLIAADKDRKLYAYLNKDVLPRAFFVNNYQVIKDGVKRLRFMNTAAFDPGKTAILEQEPETAIKAPDSTYVEFTEYRPDRIGLRAYTDRPALLVLSEIYYPEGWRATLDGEERLKIYKTDHLLRSVILPAGEHQITMTFRPRAYYAGVRISLVSSLLVYVLLLGFLYTWYGRNLIERLKKKSNAK